MRAQTALRDSESRLRLALEVAELGAWNWDPRDGTAHLDARAAQIVGLPRAGVMNATDTHAKRIHPEDLARLNAEAAAGARTGEPFSVAYRVVHPDGSLRQVVTRGRALLDAEGNPVHVVGTNRDVTIEREAELRLRASEERFRTLVQNIRDYAIVGLDVDGGITEWTDGAARVIGYTGKSAIGRHVSMLHPPEDVERGAPQQVLSQAREQGRAEVHDWRLRRDGTRFWANAIVTAIRDDEGTVVGYTKVIRDLSEQKEMIEQREQLLAEATAARAEAERANQAKDEFLITLSHELRTPLAPILLWARALLEGSVPAHDVDHAVEAIVLSAESQLQLIEDLRDLSRLKSGPRPAGPADQLCRGGGARGRRGDHARRAGEGRDRRARRRARPRNAVLDRGRFQQVLWNLLSNAVKFTPEGGRVSLRVRRDDGQLEVVVADTGAGIEASFLPHLFQRFRRRPRRTHPSASGTPDWASDWRCAATSSSSTAAWWRGPARGPAAAPCSRSRFPG